MNTLLWMDRFLSRSLKLLILFLFLSIILLLGLVSIPGFFADIFEYEDSLWDLSNIEIGYVALLTALFYRHFTYCFKYQIGFWKAMTSPFYALGYLTFSYLALLGLVELVAVYSAESSQNITPQAALEGLNGVEQMVWFILLSLAVYLSTPTESETRATQESPASNFSHSQSADAEHHQERKSI